MTSDADLGGDPPCWAHLFDDDTVDDDTVDDDTAPRSSIESNTAFDLSVMAGESGGAVWSLAHGGDLDANLVRLESDGGVGEHVNNDVDVLLVARSGGGTVTIDGTPDAVGTDLAAWEYVEGAQANISMVATFSGSYVPTLEQVYVDDTTPSATECWGDGDYYGASGQASVSGIPDTDPRSGAFDTFQARQVAAFWPTNLDMSGWTPAWAAEALQDLDATVTDF